MAYLKIRFFSRPNLIIYKAYTISERCSLMHDAMAYVSNIQNINTRIIVRYPAKLF